MGKEVFISYSRKDIATVKEIKKYIDNAVGIDCWFDIDGIESGEQFEDVIISAICNHDTILFMKSAQSMQSEWALDELDFAKRKNRRIVLVHIDDAEMTDKFYFRYHKFDQIIWKDPIQREKLINNLRKWFPVDLRTNVQFENEIKREAEEETNFQKKPTALENKILTSVQKDGKWGFADECGKVVIPFKWRWAKNFSDDLALVADDNWKYGYIDKTGKVVIPCKWEDAKDFSEGLAPVKLGNWSWGFINKTGKLVIPEGRGVWRDVWRDVEKFSDGLALVQNDNEKWGYIDKTGKVVIPCKWGWAKDFSDGLASVLDENGRFLKIDKTGKVVK